ncbi:triokinase/FMN cyclase isoform X1 [Triplophysa dalaica]|uniref:triokinase/FMN cyclase isoform X1 n=2 Tax=Triplophysa dalaica TaxID=1582913 RepID=UPI0024DF5A77|nr:triokinase/FMN cyclase isoform X1 [Triplophysa dalaica]
MMEVGRKLLNSVDKCVDDALEGLVRSNASLVLLRGHRVVLRTDLENIRGKVALLSGGGSGHEPAHAGYIGMGMLSGAVAGAVFASPPAGSILAAIQALWSRGASGVLLVVKNYTGDRLNFGIAAEQAQSQGIKLDMVIVADDCAFTQPSKAGRRGLCGTVLVHKLAGALAEEGCPLDTIVARVNEALKNIGTLGVSLSPCSVPGCLPSFQLPTGEMELGLGMHGEPGIWRSKVASANEVVKTMISHMTDSYNKSHLPLKSGDSVVLSVNNLGALSCLEIAVVTKAAVHFLEEHGVLIVRVMSGSFMTSLEMAGMSLTLLKVDEEILRLFDAKTTAPAWPNLSSVSVSRKNLFMEPVEKSAAPAVKGNEGSLASSIRHVLESVCRILLQYQDELNALDRTAGDGDCGNTHALAANAILEWLSISTIPGNAGLLLADLALLVQERMGGSSGALYSLFLSAAVPHLAESCDGTSWAKALHAGTEAMKRYGGAEVGDRTMLDALCPAVEELKKLSTVSPGGHMDILQAAVEKADLGAESTCNLTARAGRASYIASEHLTQPDPGATAVAIILKAVLNALKGDRERSKS